jgi:hypothetical protein
MNSKRTVSRFLRTAVAAAAAGHSGNSRIEDFSPDSDGRVGRTFSGAYTVEEVRALLADLERVQRAYVVWAGGSVCHNRACPNEARDNSPYCHDCGARPLAQVEGDTFFERNAGNVAARSFGV